MTENRHLILCGDVPDKVPKGYKGHHLHLGKDVGQINLGIDALNEKMVRELPPILHDLLDISVYVYVGDQIISRGGEKSFDYGHRWNRRMAFRISGIGNAGVDHPRP